jgi:hypothetical protein
LISGTTAVFFRAFFRRSIIALINYTAILSRNEHVCVVWRDAIVNTRCVMVVAVEESPRFSYALRRVALRRRGGRTTPPRRPISVIN